jgi:hypothetical protein
MRYGFTLLGQIIVALAQPFLLNAPTKFAASWFSPTSRATVNTVATFANPLGIAVGSLLVPGIADSLSSIPTMLLVIAIIPTVTAFPTLFIRSLPPSPPGPVDAHESTGLLLPGTFMQGLRQALSFPAFRVLIFAFSLGVAVFSAVSSLLQNIVTPYGYTNDEAGIFDALMILGGIFGAGITAPVIDRTGWHARVLKGATPLAAAGFLGLIFAVRRDAFDAIAAVSFFVGFFIFALLPVGLELGVEATYPVPEGTSSGILWMSAQLAALIIQLVMNALRVGADGDPPYHMRGALIMAAVILALVAVLVNVRFRTAMRRREAEQAHQAPPAPV